MRLEYLVWSDVVSHIVGMLIAYALALPIGWDREAATNGGNVTAVSIWVTGAIGAATGFALYDVAHVMSQVTFLSLRTKNVDKDLR